MVVTSSAETLEPKLKDFLGAVAAAAAGFAAPVSPTKEVTMRPRAINF